MNWGYFDKFEGITDKYLPAWGEGNTKAEQAVTAVSKLIYKWYNDGDVYDNRFAMRGWCNNLSSYANWLATYTTDKVKDILCEISRVISAEEYEDILVCLADMVLNEDFLQKMSGEKEGSIYSCDGCFEFVEDFGDEEEYWEDDEEDW